MGGRYCMDEARVDVHASVLLVLLTTSGSSCTPTCNSLSTVRELAPTEKLSGDQVSYVDLEGLGRVPFSNIRRPRPLMDVPADDSEAAAGGKPDRRRRLDQEPLLAARIMIEDCNCLVLDVQDIHRIFIAAANGAMVVGRREGAWDVDR